MNIALVSDTLCLWRFGRGFVLVKKLWQCILAKSRGCKEEDQHRRYVLDRETAAQISIDSVNDGTLRGSPTCRIRFLFCPPCDELPIRKTWKQQNSA